MSSVPEIILISNYANYSMNKQLWLASKLSTKLMVRARHDSVLFVCPLCSKLFSSLYSITLVFLCVSSAKLLTER